MHKVFSNGGDGDFVINPFNNLIAGSSRLHLAAPYFNVADPILQAIRDGKRVQLLVGLNAVTSPKALSDLHLQPNMAIRYLTRRFHAKIYLSDAAALLGSANLTRAGLQDNREAVICIDRRNNADMFEEVHGLFLELWEAGKVLTTEKLEAFRAAYNNIYLRKQKDEEAIEAVVGRAEPRNVRVFSDKVSNRQAFLEALRQEVYEQYRPAFNEVTAILERKGFRRNELVQFGIANETNRFLSHLRETHVQGVDAWKKAPLLDRANRKERITRFGREWVDAVDNKVVPDYAERLDTVKRIFGTSAAIEGATKEELTDGLKALHAFSEQYRFVLGGDENLGAKFWKRNNHDLVRVRSTLHHLLYGPGDFIERLYDILNDPYRKVTNFGPFCALELYGTVKPEECPPMNGRIAKALRYLGFDVKAE